MKHKEVKNLIIVLDTNEREKEKREYKNISSKTTRILYTFWYSAPDNVHI